jgi:hypothetical protein
MLGDSDLASSQASYEIHQALRVNRSNPVDRTNIPPRGPDKFSASATLHTLAASLGPIVQGLPNHITNKDIQGGPFWTWTRKHAERVDIGLVWLSPFIDRSQDT